MTKPVARSKGGSETVDAINFGDHITGDHLITRNIKEESIDGDRSALVMKDVATDFRWVYPSARHHTSDCIRAFKHFIRPEDKVGIFYSDNSDELRKASAEMGWRHNTSVDYISKSNAIAERNLRSVLDGTRVNLEQAGLHHSYWPYAARHWCMSHNILEDPELKSPWSLRFGEKFKGPIIPFGSMVEFWTGPERPSIRTNLQYRRISGIYYPTRVYLA